MATRGRGDAREHASCCAEVVRTRDARRTRRRPPPRPPRSPRSARALLREKPSHDAKPPRGNEKTRGIRTSADLAPPPPRLPPPPLPPRLSSRCYAASRVPARTLPGIPWTAATPRATWWRAEPRPPSARSLEATARPPCPPPWTASAATPSPTNPTTPRTPPPPPTARTRSPARSDASSDAYAAIDPSTPPTSSSTPNPSVAEAWEARTPPNPREGHTPTTPTTSGSEPRNTAEARPNRRRSRAAATRFGFVANASTLVALGKAKANAATREEPRTSSRRDCFEVSRGGTWTGTGRGRGLESSRSTGRPSRRGRVRGRARTTVGNRGARG